MDEINKRLFDLLRDKRGAQTELAYFLGINKSVITSWKKRHSKIPSKFIPKIAEFLNTNEIYLLNGTQEQTLYPSDDFILSESEQKIIQIYRNATIEGQEKISEQVELLGEKYRKDNVFSIDKKSV